jgi:hypothetical protein
MKDMRTAEGEDGPETVTVYALPEVLETSERVV